MDDSEFQKLLNTSPPTTIKPSRATIGLVILTVLCGASAMAWIGHYRYGQAFIINSSLIAIIFAIICYPSISIRVVLEKNSFTVKQLFGPSNIYAWKDVSEFTTHTKIAGRTRYSGRQSSTIKFLYKPYGHTHEFELPNGRLTLTQATQLLNHWRERALTHG